MYPGYGYESYICLTYSITESMDLIPVLSSFLQRLPRQIEERNEKLKKEMLGK